MVTKIVLGRERDIGKSLRPGLLHSGHGGVALDEGDKILTTVLSSDVRHWPPGADWA